MSTHTQITIEDNLLLMAKGEYKQVHACAIAAIHKNVNDPIPYFLLAKLTFDHKNYPKAKELFEKALHIEPDNIYFLTYYAQALTFLSDHGYAKKLADNAAELKPKHPHLSDTIGVVYSRLGFHEKAIFWFRQAVDLDPKPANYHYNLAASLQFLGKFEEAEACYEATLARDPDNYRALASLVSLKKQTQDNNNLPTLLSAFEQLKHNTDAALHIGHALAKTYEDMGDYPTSLTWLKKAKAGKASASAFDYKPIFNAAKNTVGHAERMHMSESFNQSAPIFIVGLPRTGTTLVDRIISSHRDVVSGGELNAFAELVKKQAKTPSNLVLDEETLNQSQNIAIDVVGEKYMQATKDLHRNAQRCTDKMPLNFFYAGLIHQALPNARIIALRRGAMDSCLSNYRQLLTTQHTYYDYTYNLKSTADFYRLFDDLMGYWRTHLPQDRFMEIRYEDIVYDQENQTRRLLAFCGLDWDNACMRFHENEAPVSTASSVQVRQPLYSGSIGRWKRYGDMLDDLKADLGALAE